MKKCTQCGKIYDDTWMICFHCSLILVDVNQAEYESTIKAQAQTKKMCLNCGQIFSYSTHLCDCGNSYLENFHDTPAGLEKVKEKALTHKKIRAEKKKQETSNALGSIFGCLGVLVVLFIGLGLLCSFPVPTLLALILLVLLFRR